MFSSLRKKEIPTNVNAKVEFQSNISRALKIFAIVLILGLFVWMEILLYDNGNF
jgi:hypothetical protein